MLFRSLVSGRPQSHNGEDPALWAYHRRGAAVAAPHRRTSQGWASGHSLAGVTSRLAQAAAGGVHASSHAVGPYACEQEVSCGRQDAEEAAETQETQAAEEARRVENTRSSTSSEAPLWPRQPVDEFDPHPGRVRGWAHCIRGSLRARREDAPSCPLMRMETESWGPGSIRDGLFQPGTASGGSAGSG